MNEDSKKNICDFCGKELDYEPFKCKFCGYKFCSEHRIPEKHNCLGLEEWKKKNKDRWAGAIEESKTSKNIKANNKIKSKLKVRKSSSSFFASIKRWLNKREHYTYNYSGNATLKPS